MIRQQETTTTMTSHLDDLKSAIYTAAHDGDVDELRRLIEAQQKCNVRELVSSKTGAATPLIAACFNGHTEVVRYLVEECAADMEQMGHRDEDPHEDVTPLWFAASNLHLDIVELLVTRGANVNSVTCTKSTLLMEACLEVKCSIIEYLLDNKADINMPDQSGMTCLMQGCRDGQYGVVKYLIDRGADVNRKDCSGDTALHYCATSDASLSIDSDSESDSEYDSDTYPRARTHRAIIAIIKLLVKCKVKMEKNVNGLTPLLLAADDGKEDIVEYLIPIAESERAAKIDALELLGARSVANNDLTSALMYWRLAMEERFRDGFDVIQKPVNRERNTAYENAVEVKSLDELNDDLISDPDAMQMQALLVRERILGARNYRTLSGIKICGDKYAVRGSSERCLRLWTYALDMEQQFSEPLDWHTTDILESFANLFSSMIAREPHNVDFDVILSILKKSVFELQRGKAVQMYDNDLLLTTITIISLLCRIQGRFSEQQVYNFKRTAYEFVKLNLRDERGYTPLQLVCEGSVHFRDFGFPARDVARLLMEMGALVNARSHHRHG